jgi:drug/metabolite transporter (DMT)-like permease
VSSAGLVSTLRDLGLVLVTSSSTVACQLLAKKGVSRLAPLEFGEQPLRTLFAMLTSPWVLSGLAIQAFGFSLWLTVIARTNLTWAVGVASALVFVLTAILNWAIFDERVTMIQAFGILLLIVGIALLSGGGAIERVEAPKP